jgi:hypothetical protein
MKKVKEGKFPRYEFSNTSGNIILDKPFNCIIYIEILGIINTFCAIYYYYIIII